MCGIVGFVGETNGVKFLIDGLSSLEYRGYDSAGIAGVVNGEAKVTKAHRQGWGWDSDWQSAVQTAAW